MVLFAGSKAEQLARGPCLNPNWWCTADGRYPRLLHLDPEGEGLTGVSGVFVVWHAGIRPAWVYVGRSGNLAMTFNNLVEQEDIMSYEVNGGLYVSWTLIRPEYQDGVVAYLLAALKPVVENSCPPADAVVPIPVLPPGKRKPGGG